jgi:hypothetical protein
MAVNVTARVGERPASRHVARVVDVSISGAFLRIGLPVDDLHPVFIEFSTPGSRRARASIEAYVVRRGNDGVGVEWAELAPKPVMALIAALRPDASGAPPHPVTEIEASAQGSAAN